MPNKKIRIITCICFFALMFNLYIPAFAEKITPYANLTKSVSRYDTRTIYFPARDCNVVIRYKISGTYTYDRVSGLIQSASNCAISDLRMLTAPPASPGWESWNIYQNVKANSKVSSNGGSATFTATITPILELVSGSIPWEKYTLSPQTSVLVANAL